MDGVAVGVVGLDVDVGSDVVVDEVGGVVVDVGVSVFVTVCVGAWAT